MSEYPHRKEKEKIQELLRDLLHKAQSEEGVYSTSLTAEFIVGLFPVTGVCADCAMRDECWVFDVDPELNDTQYYCAEFEPKEKP